MPKHPAQAAGERSAQRVKELEARVAELEAALREIETTPLPYHNTVKAIARAALKGKGAG